MHTSGLAEIVADRSPGSMTPGDRAELDREQQLRQLEALNATPLALRRDECSDWRITGSQCG